MSSIYDNFTFKVLAKKSASPTLVVIVSQPDRDPYVMKIWNASTTTVQYQALDYERAVYQTQINTILQENPDAPFLRYIGEGCDVTVTQLGQQIGITTPEAWNVWKTVMYIYLKHPFNEFAYNQQDIDTYVTYYGDIRRPEVLDKIKDTRLKCIMLPYVKHYTLSRMLKTVSTNRLFKYVRQIIKGLKMLYDKGVVHNDLHAGNIMINNTNDNVLIFDWDRSYVKGINNPLLNPLETEFKQSDCCEGKCQQSQCNVFKEEGYSTDLYKILHYILKSRVDDRFTLLKHVFHIYNRTRNPLNQSRVIKKLTQHAFFQTSTCSYLQCPDKQMEYIKFQFGTIDEVYIKSQAPRSANRAIPVVNHMRKAFTSTIGFLARVEGSHGVGFSFQPPSVKFEKNSNLLISNKSVYTQQFEKPIDTKKGNIIPANIPTNILKTIKYLKNIPENNATYKDLMNARLIIQYLNYGPIIDNTSDIFVKELPDPQPEYITTIIEKNNLKKYGRGHKLF